MTVYKFVSDGWFRNGVKLFSVKRKTLVNSKWKMDIQITNKIARIPFTLSFPHQRKWESDSCPLGRDNLPLQGQNPLHATWTLASCMQL